MFNPFAHRKQRKTLKHAGDLVKGVRRILRVNRDLISPERLEEFTRLCADLQEGIRQRDIPHVHALSQKLDREIEKSFPRPADAAMRENVDVLLVAVIVAMAVRTFFLQPFKIPTGSMQPTLYGIVQANDCDPDAGFLTRWRDIMVQGKWPTQPARPLLTRVVNFGGWALFGIWPGDSPCLLCGDHIFVDKVSYHFRQPKRGEVIVFETNHIPDIPPESRGKFYIKRLVGLGGDTVQFREPHVLIDGEVLDSHPAFRRIYSGQDGYRGYVIPRGRPDARHINERQDTFHVPEDGLFVLGDNSHYSLDGRFWGSVPRTELVGRALFVYWPFSQRFGFIE
jgi:signal peptidase I